MKILKNNVNYDIDLPEVGFTICVGCSHEIALIEYPLWSYSNNVIQAIENGELIVSTGTLDYTDPEAAIAFLRS